MSCEMDYLNRGFMLNFTESSKMLDSDSDSDCASDFESGKRRRYVVSYKPINPQCLLSSCFILWLINCFLFALATQTNDTLITFRPSGKDDLLLDMHEI